MSSSPTNIPPNDPRINQGHPEHTTTGSRPSTSTSSVSTSISPTTILLAILSVLSAVLIAYLVNCSTTVSTDEDAATVSRFFPLTRLFSSRQSVVRPVANSVDHQIKSSIANLGTEGSGFKMRTPVYFISHGGVSCFRYVGFVADLEILYLVCLIYKRGFDVWTMHYGILWMSN